MTGTVEEEFLEIETPILTAGTDEGAREFIVPTRKQAGSFYTLPQAPQQFKQMLMVGGFEKYFQIARCFRDEDSRGDRQPEFTQLDLEMAFTSMQKIIDLNTKLFNEVVIKIYGNQWILKPFEIITYKDAMDFYGCDRPDLRFGLQMQDITEIVKETTFQVFSKPIEDGGIVKCIKVSAKEQGYKRMSKGQIENLTAIAQQHGLGGLAYIIVNENDLQSPIIKFLGEEIAEGIYSNLAIINHSVSEFVLDFICIMPGTPKNKVKSRIIITPQHAKRLSKALNDNIVRFEKKNGEIKEVGDGNLKNTITK